MTNIIVRMTSWYTSVIKPITDLSIRYSEILMTCEDESNKYYPQKR
jgi:hypothetical protein